MNIGFRNHIFILLILIIVIDSILIIKIKAKPNYDEDLYNEVYSQYGQMLATINKDLEMYSKNNPEDLEKNSQHIVVNTNGDYYIIAGEISIPKIGINYPIINETTDEYLKIAPTKYAGPGINEVGNFCILGHNYKNKQFFSRISELQNGDKVYLTSNEGEKKEYIVYDKFEIQETDFTITDQETNGNIEATLITCTNNKNKRLAVKCREN